MNQKRESLPPSQDDWQRLSEVGRVVITLYVLLIVYRQQLSAVRAGLLAALALAALPALPEHPIRVVLVCLVACAVYLRFKPYDKKNVGVINTNESE
jgi:hypothetical protein